ncbi:MAG: high-potential iron-sulfur protein [Granulosicoccus sp.]|nr:high-potential iron-sulfur protein [Granulosicoccus sp.]
MRSRAREFILYRRDFLKYGFASAATASLIAGCGSGDSGTPSPSTPPMGDDTADPCDSITPFTPLEQVEACGELVDPASDSAVRLAYEQPSTRPSESCANCSFYEGQQGSVSGQCSFFPQQLVAANAWCSVYRPV